MKKIIRFKLIYLVLFTFLTGCAGELYKTDGGYKRHHTSYKTDKSHKQAQTPEGEELWMICSYYADKFHGRNTSNGEVFDMYEYTCAHKKLPFNTELRVTDPDTNKSVQVRVNDRGPFIAGRDLDLSYAAAKDVGMIPFGVKKMKVKIISKP
jgi:rare lipoprotein A